MPRSITQVWAKLCPSAMAIRKLWFSSYAVFVGYLFTFPITCLSFELTNSSVMSERSCPAVCSCDGEWDLIDCSYRYLVEPPKLPMSSRVLNLAGNRIVHLSAVHLTGLSRLQELDFSSNQIRDLPPDVFIPVRLLSNLDISRNQLGVLPTAAIAQISGLRRLSLAGNLISSLSWTESERLNSLEYLDMSDNQIASFPSDFFNSLPSLSEFTLSGNQIESVVIEPEVNSTLLLTTLDLSSNFISHLSIARNAGFTSLTTLDISGNRFTAVDKSWFSALPSLAALLLDSNPIEYLGTGTFSEARNLRQLSLCEMNRLTSITKRSLWGLNSLELLNVCNSSSLMRIQIGAFADLGLLQLLDLRNNQLQRVSHKLFTDLNENVDVLLSGNPWNCDCHLERLHFELESSGRSIGSDIICASPASVRELPLYDVMFNDSLCNHSDETAPSEVVHAPLGSEFILDCEVTTRQAVDSLTWSFGDEKIIEGRPLREKASREKTGWAKSAFVETWSNLDESEAMRITLSSNGSLVIHKIMRYDTGYYQCLVSYRFAGEVASAIELRLDYSVMSMTLNISFIVGFISAAVFFSFAAILGISRYLAYVCSPEERAKRRSLRELLAEIRSGAHVDRLSAYRSAKMGQFAAFKSATMDQLSSFKTEKVGRLRKYKQATVSAVLHQLDRMREHYAAQTTRIKDSYVQNVERLRDNYSHQRARFQDRRSIRVQHIRKQYQARVERAREYSVSQVARLREQYKQQQQYFLKLLELIEVGSCVSQAVEVECMRAESAIFDAGAMTFDEEARPSHATRGQESLLFDTVSLPDGFPVIHDALTELSSDDVEDDDGIEDFLPPLDIRMRSLSASNVIDRHLTLSTENVQIHRSSEAEPEDVEDVRKPRTPALCGVHEPPGEVVTVTMV